MFLTKEQIEQVWADTERDLYETRERFEAWVEDPILRAVMVSLVNQAIGHALVRDQEAVRVVSTAIIAAQEAVGPFVLSRGVFE